MNNEYLKHLKTYLYCGIVKKIKIGSNYMRLLAADNVKRKTKNVRLENKKLFAFVLNKRGTACKKEHTKRSGQTKLRCC
jgi:hypothetical protein